MMSISQIDMVVLGDQSLQVCGNLERVEDEGGAPSSGELQSFLFVVRQGGNVAPLHVAPPFDSDSKEFHPDTGRWELTCPLRPGDHFEAGQDAVVTAVVVLDRGTTGLEMLSWVQPVTIHATRTPADPTQQVVFHAEPLARPTARPLEIGHSVSSSLAISRDGPTFSAVQQADDVPPAIHHPAP